MLKKMKWLSNFILVIFVVTIALGSNSTMYAKASNISDVNGHWAETQINELVDDGIISGYPDGTFKPEGKITRAEFASIIVKGFNLSEGNGKVFADTKGHWGKDSIATANAYGIVNGYSDTTFGPDDPITREQMAVMVVKAAKLTDVVDSKIFADSQNISDWAKSFVDLASGYNIITGYPDNTFKPQGNATRAEAAVVLSKSIAPAVTPPVVKEPVGDDYSLIDKAGTYGPASGTETVAGDVTIKAKDTVLQNLVIEGDLIIAKEVGDGDVTLNNIKVEGKTYIRGGGKDSIHINGGTYSEVIVEKTASGAVRIVVVDNSGLRVTISENASGEEVILNGDFKSVTVNADDVKLTTQTGSKIDEIKVQSGLEKVNIELAKDSSVKEMVLDSKVEVKGEGEITKASGTRANTSTFEAKPGTISTPGTGGSSGSSGGGGESSTKVSVSLEVPAEEASPYHIDVIVLNASTSAPITGLVKEDFTIKSEKYSSWLINILEVGGMYGDKAGHYTLYPNEDVDVYCPVMGYDVRIPVGKYTLEFSKDGYQDASIPFEVRMDPCIEVLGANNSINAGDENPSLVVTLYYDTFKAGESAMNPTNWEIDTGETALTAGGTILIVGDTAKIPFAGTAAAGTITIKAKAAALNRGIDSLVLTEKVGDIEIISEENAIYGPEDGIETVAGNLKVAAKGVTLRNLIIKGDLIIAEEVGDGDVTLNNITVEGKTYVCGGGKDSIHINGGQYNEVIVEKTTTGAVRIVAVDNSGLRITIAENATGEEVILSGEIKSVTVKADDVKLTTQTDSAIGEIKIQGGLKNINIDLAQDSTVKEMVLDSKITVTGTGTTNKASGTRANTSNFETTPDVISSPGSGGGSYPTPVAVTGITLDKTRLNLVAGGTTGKITATVAPANATNKNVNWTSSDETVATVASGVVVPLAEGTALITATTVDGNKTSTTVVTVVELELEFTPGEGGTIKATPVFEAEGNKIGGLYIEKNHDYYSYIFGNNPSYRHRIEMKFLPPSHFGATSYKLQYSEDSGATWNDYLNYEEVVLISENQDNITASNPSSVTIMFRLVVIGGSKAGYTSNTVTAKHPIKKTWFKVWSLDESVYVSGVMYPWVGRGLEASFTAVHQIPDEEDIVYTDEYMDYQWYRVNPKSYEMTAIPGATNLKYITTNDDIGYNLLVRATGNDDQISGFIQVMSENTGLLEQNKAYINNITDTGFTLNLYKFVPELKVDDLILTDYNRDSVTINGVTQGDNAAIYNITANLDRANGPFYLSNNAEFWSIASSPEEGYLRQEVVVPYAPEARKVNLEVPLEEVSPYHIDVIVTNVLTSEPITGLVEEDFRITFGESGSYPIDMLKPGGMYQQGGQYTLYPNNDEFIDCPVLGPVRIPVGSYKLEFSKPGYQDASILFEIAPAPALSNDATLTSTIGTVDNDAETITDVPSETILADFKGAITPAADADFEVYEADGTTVGTDIQDGYKVIVTAEDGTTKTYTISFAV